MNSTTGHWIFSWVTLLPAAAATDSTSLFTGKGPDADLVLQGSIYSKKFNAPGAYQYKCHNHGEQMKGVTTPLPQRQ